MRSTNQTPQALDFSAWKVVALEVRWELTEIACNCGQLEQARGSCSRSIFTNLRDHDTVTFIDLTYESS